MLGKILCFGRPAQLLAALVSGLSSAFCGHRNVSYQNEKDLYRTL